MVRSSHQVYATFCFAMGCVFLLALFCGCGRDERNLIGNYKLTWMNGCEIRIWRPDREGALGKMLSGTVKTYAVRDPYITGYATTECLDPSGEPEARTGYFLIDTRLDEIDYGMGENRWRQKLRSIGWSNPELRKPRVWF